MGHEGHEGNMKEAWHCSKPLLEGCAQHLEMCECVYVQNPLVYAHLYQACTAEDV